ncbi:MAG: hypothetical protein LBG06_05305, partial [Deltaproteobacteria bacterium]|nr:hypothetical protein [Deltaproteobacteria bacterium]
MKGEGKDGPGGNGPGGHGAAPVTCSFCGRPIGGGLPLFRAAGPDGAVVCWFCAHATHSLAARGALPRIPDGVCSFCGESAPAAPPPCGRPGAEAGESPGAPAEERPEAAAPGEGLDGDRSPFLASGPGGERLCPSCAAMILELAEFDDPVLHDFRDPWGEGTAPPVWFGLLGGFSPLTLVGGPARGPSPGAGKAAEISCSVCGRTQSQDNPLVSFSRQNRPDLFLCESCLTTASAIFSRVRPIPARRRAECSVCGELPSLANPVLSLPGPAAMNICLDCIEQCRQTFSPAERRRGDSSGRRTLRLPIPPWLGMAPIHWPSPRPPRTAPVLPPGTGPGQETPPEAGGGLPLFEKLLLQRHSNWRITSSFRMTDQVRRFTSRPCCFCGELPAQGNEMLVLGPLRSDLRICGNCVRLYAGLVRNSRPKPEDADARCALCGLPPRPGLAMVTGSFPRRLRLCETCIETLEGMLPPAPPAEGADVPPPLPGPSAGASPEAPLGASGE